jgi:hypothetical protein
MSDLITSARAEYNINQSTFSSAEQTTIAALVTAVSKAVRRYARREFDSQSFDEFYSGDGRWCLQLNQYPIISISRVAAGPRVVLTIRNNSSTNQRATVAVGSTGLTFTRVASGTVTSDTSITWVGNPTLQAIANAVKALGNGWSASLFDSNYALWPSADFGIIQGPLNAKNVDAPLKLHVDELSDYEIDANRGWLLRRGLGAIGFDTVVGGTLGAWVEGRDNYRVTYTAGYTTVPEDVQQACAEWVAALFWETKENPAIVPDLPTPSVASLLASYRRYPILP